jgi:hypothetical protein
MPDYSKLRGLMSHRVRIDYDTGAAVCGYLSACRPEAGPVQFVSVANAELKLADGTVLESHEEIWLPANAQISFALDEGPQGRQ